MLFNLARSLLSNRNVFPGYHILASNKKLTRRLFPFLRPQIAIRMQSADEHQLWWPGQSLWSLIAEHVLGSELPRIRTALGCSLVDMYTERHSEAEMWHKMWQESREGNNNSRAENPLPRQQGFPLADPPAVKELVRGEVKMLLQTLRERTSRGGRDWGELLCQYKPETVDYALGYLDSCYRNSANCGDTDNGSRPNSHCSLQSSAEDEIEAVRDKLNVSGIDEVVSRLRSVLMEECEALTILIKHLKVNIKQKSRRPSCEFVQSEPTLTELRELRQAIQTDLELYPSSFAALPSASFPLPLKDLKSRCRPSAGQRVSAETQQALRTTSVLRPHPPPCPPPLNHTKAKPPLGAHPGKTSGKLVNSSSLSNRQHRSSSACTGPRKTQAPSCNRITTSGPGSDQIMVKSAHHFNLSAEKDRSAPTPCHSFQKNARGNSPSPETHLSSSRTAHSLSRQSDLSPQTQRRGSLARRSRNINTITSPVPALSTRCDAGSYSSNETHRSVSTARESKTQSRRQTSNCGGILPSTTVQTDKHRGKGTSESFHSCVGSRRSNNGTDTNKNGDPEKDVTLVQSRSCCSQHPESSDTRGQAACSRPASIQTKGHVFTSPKRPDEGTASQPKSVQEAQMEPEFINKFYHSVPPAKVLT